MEAYRRLRLPEKVVSSALAFPSKAGKNIMLVVSGAAKVYGADIVARAKETQEDWGETGPLRPEHLKEALRRYRTERGDMLPRNTRMPDPTLML